MSSQREKKKINLWNPHENQKKLIQDKKRFKVILCGRRFGKTTYSVNTLVKHALLKQKGEYFYIAPTYKQAKMIAWKMLLESVQKLPKELVHKINESELYVIIGNNSRIDIKGADNPDSLRGVGLDGVVLDEYADMKPNVFQEIIRPALTDKKGFAIFIGTPKGFNHFYDIYSYAEQDEKWSAYRFTTYDNPLIDPEEIEEARKAITEDRFAQEYMADFRKMEGLVYKEFDRSKHIYIEEVPRTNVVLGAIDFGYTNPTAVLRIVQDNDNHYWVTGEWYRTGKTNEEIIEYVKSQDFNKVYPDPAEPDRIEEMNRAGLNIQEVSKDISKGVDSVRNLFKQDRIHIHKSCTNLISELESYRYPEKRDDKNPDEKPIKENDHALDALRYALYMQEPVVDEIEEDWGLYEQSYI